VLSNDTNIIDIGRSWTANMHTFAQNTCLSFTAN